MQYRVIFTEDIRYCFYGRVMMKVIAVVQNKGGVGKTTVTRVLAEYFSRQGQRVLVLDLDAQCNLSRRFLTMEYDAADPDGVLPPLHPEFDISDDQSGWSGRSSSADIYFSGDVYPYPTQLDSLLALPGHGPRLREIELVRSDEVRDAVHNRLHLFLSLVDVQRSFDLVFIDTAPAKGPLTISAVRAATHLIIPTTLEPQPIEGLYGMLQLWRREQNSREADRPLQIAAIQPNLFRKGVALHEGLLDSLRDDQALASMLSPVILRQRIAFAESDHPGAQPKSLFDLSPKDPAHKEVLAFCEHIHERLIR
ncbi:ParA family protein [Thiocystis violacea]|uniref:ParA family protein n=1 Tax=Thiocystis violacea TaxID=13725 RepID=UPI00190795CA|nr:ParA family protein [Thiocystis violacea]